MISGFIVFFKFVQIFIHLSKPSGSVASVENKKPPTKKVEGSTRTPNVPVLELYYQDLHEIYNLREILMNEGILEYQPESPLFIDKVTNLTLPLRN